MGEGIVESPRLSPVVFFYSDDVDRLARFYTEVLGFKVRERRPRHSCWLDTGAVTLVLHQSEKQYMEGPYDPAHDSTLIWIATSRSIQEIRARVLEAGVEISGDAAHQAERGLLVIRDFEGRRIGLSASTGNPRQDVWYHGSPHRLEMIRPGSTITRDRELARVFSHKPNIVSIEKEEEEFKGYRHTGRSPGFLYRIAEPVEEKDLTPHPDSTLTTGQEWLTTRPLRLELVEHTEPRDDELLSDEQVAELLKRGGGDRRE